MYEGTRTWTLRSAGSMESNSEATRAASPDAFCSRWRFEECHSSEEANVDILSQSHSENVDILSQSHSANVNTLSKLLTFARVI